MHKRQPQAPPPAHRSPASVTPQATATHRRPFPPFPLLLTAMAWALVLAADHFWPPAPDQHATLRWARVAAAHPLRLFFGFYLLLWAAFPQRPARASTEPSSEGHQQPPRT